VKILDEAGLFILQILKKKIKKTFLGSDFGAHNSFVRWQFVV